jgi:predicted RNA-binding protein with PUA-like domain
MNYWLLKSEPEVYGIRDLQHDRTTLWDGVRNYQARNFLRAMQTGDRAFFYHSNTMPPGIVGLVQVIETNVVDPTQFETASKYYDPKSTVEAPRWQTVTVEFLQAFATLISLETLRQQFSPDDLWVVRPGNRLSVIPVPGPIAQQILDLATADRSIL